jgi:hypothetical protein
VQNQKVIPIVGVKKAESFLHLTMVNAATIDVQFNNALLNCYRYAGDIINNNQFQLQILIHQGIPLFFLYFS